MAHRLKDGWRLYYSEEGYPYYYNEVTGDSEWAQIGENYETQQEHHDTQQYDYTQYPSPRKATGDPVPRKADGDEDDESEDDSDEEDDEESGQSTDSMFDEAFNEKFKAFLQTPEGMAAVASEQERINKFMEKKSKAMQEQSEKEYVRKLMINKKNDGDIRSKDNNFLDAVSSFFGAGGNKSPSRNKVAPQAEEEAPPNPDLSLPKRDMFGRAASRRQRKRSATDGSGSQGADDMESGGTMSRTNSSSEVESLSSEDSDVEVINAPLFSELPEWLRPANLYDRYLAPVNTYLHRHGVYASAQNTTQYITTRGAEVLTTLGQSSVVLAQQSAVVLGATLYTAGSLAWTQVEPYLVHFMQTVIDTPLHRNIRNGPSRNMQSSSSREAAGEGDEVDAESVSVHITSDNNGEANTISDTDWKTLPEAPGSPVIDQDVGDRKKADTTIPAETVAGSEEGAV